MLKRFGRLGAGLAGTFLLLVGWGTVVHAEGVLPPGGTIGSCKTWVQVNDDAFGLASNGTYTGEEGFEVAVFNDQLYVGMEADNEQGARLWRTKPGVVIPRSQNDWEEVAADALGHPFGLTATAQNDHVDSLAAFNGVLYVSTANRSGTISGTLLYSSTTGAPNSWTPVISPGFGDINNVNFKDMITFAVAETAWLCGGTGNGATGAEVWCTRGGGSWQQKNDDGFGEADNTLVASSGIFSDALYLGVANLATQGSVWRTTELLTWTQVFTAAAHRPRVEIVGAFNDALYIAAGAMDGRKADDPTIRLYRSATGDPNTWTALDTPLADDVHNARTIVDGAAVYNGALYVTTMNTHTGSQVWRTADGEHWSQVNNDGFGSADTFAAEILPFHGYLYAWTSNYATGQEVWRTACPIRKSITPTVGGAYAMPGVGAYLTFTQGTPDVVTVSVYPGAYPLTSSATPPVARMYEITHKPSTSTFSADLTLSYLEEELKSSEVSDVFLRLARWDGTNNVWSACSPTQSRRNLSARTVTCKNVTDFSTWVFSGTKISSTYLPSVVKEPGAQTAGARSWMGGMILTIVRLTLAQPF